MKQRVVPGFLVRSAAGGGLAFIAIACIAVVLARFVPVSLANEWTLWLAFGLLALSFAFVWGQGGMFSFGQAAFFGIGGYGYAIAGINLAAHTGETISAVVIGVAVAAVAASLLGYFVFWGNVGGVYLAIITLATSVLLLTIMGSLAGSRYRIGDAALGGYNGIPGVPTVHYGMPGGAGTALTPSELLAFVFGLSALTLLGLRWLMRRPFGRILIAVRENELRTQLLGYDVRRHKLVAFVLGGAIAGLGGALYAAWGNFINPSVFSLSQAALVAIWVLVGGRRSLIGAFAGVILIQRLTSELGGSGGRGTPIVLGGVMIAVVTLLPEGLVPTLVAGVRRLVPAPRPAPAILPELEWRAAAALPSRNARSGATLETTELGRSFGGLVALDDVSLKFDPGVHCLIGPNGAGKSTFFNLLVGRYRPSSGQALFDGAPLDGWRPDERARRGIGIKLQVPSLYADLSVAENVWLAAYGHLRDAREATKRAVEVLERLGLAERAQDLAGEVAHGEQQWLDIGMVLAQAPRLILLDEPTAGMTREETRRTVELVTALGEGASVVVVEHDMRFVREINAPVTVFHEGRVFARGSIEELRQDPRLLDIYLGRAASAAD